jgi:putative methanogen marker protein 4
LSERIYRLASSKKAKVIVGLDPVLPSAETLVNSALFEKRGGYAEPVLVSGCKVENISEEGVIGGELPLIVDESPEETLVELLKSGAVDAAVRGNLGSRKLVPLLRSKFDVKNLCRVTVLEFAGGLVMLAPVGIEEGDTRRDLLLIARSSLMLSQNLGIPLKVAVISGGRLEDKGRSPKVDRMLKSAESLVQDLLKLGMIAENYGIELERAIGEGSTLILAPDGIMGNLIFRSLVLVANIESYGACAASLPRTYIDTSRAKGRYLLPIILASALSKKTV